MPSQPMWGEHRQVAEVMGEAIADATAAVLGNPVELGLIQSYSPETMVSAVNFPQRAVVVRFTSPVRDAMIVLTSLSDDHARNIASAAATAALTSIDVPMSGDSFTLEPTLEYANLDEAVDEWDALFLEATYDISLQHGDLRVVLGTGLLESATCHAHGMADPFAEGNNRDDEQLGTSIGLEGDDAYAITPAKGVPVPTASIEPSILDQLDAELAAEEAMAEAEREALAAMAVAAPTAAAAHAPSAAEMARDAADANSDRWASLLSGVEVELSAELGRCDLALGDITALDAESVLTLDQMVNEPVTVYVNGTPYATARLVVVDGEYGIEILTVMEQAPLLHTLAA